MRNSLAAIALCISAAVAGAHIVTEDPGRNAMDTPAAADAQSVPAAQPAVRWIKTSDTDTEHDLPMDDAPPVFSQGHPVPAAGEQRPRRANAAMLLAVVGVMTGIALRHYGTRMR